MTISGKMKRNVQLKISEVRVEKIRHRMDLDAQIAKLTAERNAIDAEIQLDMEAHGAKECTYRGRTFVEFQWSNGSRRIDVTRLRREKPELAEEYTKLYPGSRHLHYVA